MKWLEPVAELLKQVLSWLAGFATAWQAAKLRKAQEDARQTKDAYQALDAYNRLSDNELDRLLRDEIALREHKRRGL